MLEGSLARLEQAKALAALGSALRRARRPADAREPLRRALELAAACDAPGLAEHVRTELYAAGARPRTDALAGVAALTASERRVADLAAAGRDQPRHRPGALRHAEDGRGPPLQRLPQARRPLPPRAARSARCRMSALLDRDREVAALETLVAGAPEGSGRLVLIEGPAGIGKSGLLADLRERAGGGLRVLAARASELEQAFAFGVVRQLFEADVAARRDVALAGAAAPAAAVFASEPGADGEDPSFAALHGLYWLTLNLAAERPLLLAIDDLHWCDRPSLRFLAYLARRLDGAPVLVAATLRSGEPGADPALLGEIVDDPATLPLRPGPLGEAAVTALVRAELGGDADPAFCRACHAATGGNPLLLRQLLRTLEAEGVAPDAAHVDAVRAVGPRAVASTVLLRLARLPAAAAAVARAVSVLGESAALPGRRRARRARRAGRRRRGGRARARGDPPPRAAARRSCTRSCATPSTTSSRRASASWRTSAPRRRCATTGARHRARRRPAARRAPPRRGLGDRAARARGAPRRCAKGAADSAAAYLRRALEEPPPPERATAVLLALAHAEVLTNGPAGAERLRSAYDAVEDPATRAQVAWQLARALMFTGRAEECAAFARAAAAELPPEQADLARWIEAHELSTLFWGAPDDGKLERLLRNTAIPDVRCAGRQRPRGDRVDHAGPTTAAAPPSACRCAWPRCAAPT